MPWIQGAEPLSKLCDARRINLYPVGIEPKPRSLMQHCEGRGAPKKMGPIFRTASRGSGRRRLTSQPSSRTGENPPYGMIGGIEETSASFEVRSAPRSYPTTIRPRQPSKS